MNKKVFLKKNYLNYLLILLALITSCLSVGAVSAKFLTQTSVSDSARAAKFKLDIRLLDTESQEENQQIQFDRSDESKQLSFLITNQNEVAVRGKVKGIQLGSNTSELPKYTIDENDSFTLQPNSSTTVKVTLYAGKTNAVFDTIQNLELTILLEQVD